MRADPERRVRAALVGYGSVALKHIKALEALGDRVELVVVCEPREQTHAWITSLHGCLVMTSLDEDQIPHPVIITDEALERCALDLVILASPSGLHPSQAMAAARAGCHVLTEKPMALTARDARQMRDVALQAGVGLHVIQQLRLMPLFVALRALLEEGALGEVSTSAARVLWSRPDAYFEQSAWRGTRALDGGVLLNQANHYLDLLIWLFGAPRSVSAEVATLQRAIEAPDTAAVLLRWPSHVGTLHATLLAWPSNLEASLTILGSQGTIKLDGLSADQVACWQLARDPYPGEALEALKRADAAARRAGHLPCYERALSAIAQGDASSWAGALDGLIEVLRVVEAIELSAASGRRVVLGEDLAMAGA